MGLFWRLIVKPRIITNSVCVALVVGTLLNLVNQGEQLLTGVGIEWPRVLLNYVVPFCVASYSAAKKRNRSAIEAQRIRAGIRSVIPLLPGPTLWGSLCGFH